MIILRVDDFPGTKPEEFYKHNLENFKKFDEVVSSYFSAYILGVIPKYLTPEHTDWLRDNKHVNVALHGINHDERFPNEFQRWETEEDIVLKISRWTDHLRLLTERPIDFYIPPHNVIDRKTVDALKKVGIKTILGGPGSDPLVMDYARKQSMHFVYSEHPHWYGRSDELLNRDNAHQVICLNELNGGGPMILTLHWPWEWNIGLENLEKFLSQIARKRNATSKSSV